MLAQSGYVPLPLHLGLSCWEVSQWATLSPRAWPDLTSPLLLMGALAPFAYLGPPVSQFPGLLPHIWALKRPNLHLWCQTVAWRMLEPPCPEALPCCFVPMWHPQASPPPLPSPDPSVSLRMIELWAVGQARVLESQCQRDCRLAPPGRHCRSGGTRRPGCREDPGSL